MSKVRRESHKSLVKNSIGVKKMRKNVGNENGFVSAVVKVPTLYVYRGYTMTDDPEHFYKQVSRKTYKKLFNDIANDFTAQEILEVVISKNMNNLNAKKILAFLSKLVDTELYGNKENLKKVHVKNDGLNRFKFYYEDENHEEY